LFVFTTEELFAYDGKVNSWNNFHVEVWNGEGAKWDTRSSPNEALSHAVTFVSRINVLTDEELIVLTFFKVQPNLDSVERIIRSARKHYIRNKERASAMMYAIGTKSRN
jgi:hypothetical protein